MKSPLVTSQPCDAFWSRRASSFTRYMSVTLVSGHGTIPTTWLRISWWEWSRTCYGLDLASFDTRRVRKCGLPGLEWLFYGSSLRWALNCLISLHGMDLLTLIAYGIWELLSLQHGGIGMSAGFYCCSFVWLGTNFCNLCSYLIKDIQDDVAGHRLKAWSIDWIYVNLYISSKFK